MTLLRKQIREAAKTALTGLTTTGEHVWAGRVSRLDTKELPALLIFTNMDDGGHGASNGGATRDGQLLLRVEGVAYGTDELIDTLDQIEAEVVPAVHGSTALLALLMNSGSIGPHSSVIEILDPEGGGQRRQGSVHITFPLSFRTRYGDPSTRV